MRKLKHARFLRAIETEDSLTAEVEFALAGEETETAGRAEIAAEFGDPPDARPGGAGETFTAVLKKVGDDDYRLERIVRSGEQPPAGRGGTAGRTGGTAPDVTDELLADGGSAAGSKERFVREVLAFEGVREDMAGRPSRGPQ